MSSLRQVVSSSPAGDRRAAAAAPQGRRFGRDRRASERRSGGFPLESRDARLRFAAQAAGFGTYDMDCVTGDSVWSPEVRAIAGLPPCADPLLTEQVDSLIHPDDRQDFLDRLRASLDPAGSGEFEGEHRLLRPDGGIRRVRIKGRTFFVGEGGDRRPLAATGVVMDVTTSQPVDWARLERELRRSKEDLQLAVRAANIGIWHWDIRTDSIEWCPRQYQLFGIPANERLSQERIMAAVYPDDREGFRASAYRAMESGEEFKVEFRVAWPDGSIHWLESIGRFLFEENDNAAAGMRGIALDITERRKTEEALRRSKEDLELAIQGANIGTWHWNTQTGQVKFSDRCRQLFDIRPDEPLTYERAISAFHPDDRESVIEAHRRALEEGEEYQIEKRLLWSDGSIHWVQCIGRDLYDENTGEAVGMRGITIEVTARKVYEELLRHSKEDLESRVAQRTAELTRANEALEQSNLELQKFAYIAAHDLQTPLRSISGFAELLKQNYWGRLDRQADVWLDTLVRSARRMHDLIKDLLDYSRVESQGSPFRPTDFNQLCRDVIEALDGAIGASGASVTYDVLPVVQGDRTQLGQLLQNLVDNGLKYHGDEHPRVHVSAARDGDEWLFSVRDNGIGIAPKHQEGVFDIFRRLHTQEKYPGTGIGLAVCRRVVHRHGGRIWVESEPGRGSTFYFTLPVREKSAL